MKTSNPVLERVRAASEALADRRKRKQILDWCDAAEARIEREIAALMDDSRQRLMKLASRPALPSGPRVAPRRVAPPAAAATREQPDPFMAALTRRLK